MNSELIDKNIAQLQLAISKAIANLHNSAESQQETLWADDIDQGYVDMVSKLCNAEGALVRAYVAHEQLKMESNKDRSKESQERKLVIERRVVGREDRAH